ncbi:MAG: hypothetical protein IJF27_00165, partial [Oscillospiraceae bacterium]|nr:hypothetical protein [Oscillospiraceae bacterium]
MNIRLYFIERCYEFRCKIKMVGRAQMVLDAVSHSFKGIVAGLIMEVPVHNGLDAVFLRKLGKPGRNAPFIKRRDVEHHYLF